LRSKGQRHVSFESLPRFEELANLLLVARITQAANLKDLSVAESKLSTRFGAGRADASVLEQQFRDTGGVLPHIATADETGQHSEIRMRYARW
jgi:hypothetical protein